MTSELKKRCSRHTKRAGQCVDNFCIIYLQKKISIAAMFMVSCRPWCCGSRRLAGFLLTSTTAPTIRNKNCLPSTLTLRRSQDHYKTPTTRKRQEKRWFYYQQRWFEIIVAPPVFMSEITYWPPPKQSSGHYCWYDFSRYSNLKRYCSKTST